MMSQVYKKFNASNPKTKAEFESKALVILKKYNWDEELLRYYLADGKKNYPISQDDFYFLIFFVDRYMWFFKQYNIVYTRPITYLSYLIPALYIPSSEWCYSKSRIKITHELGELFKSDPLVLPKCWN